MNIPELIIEHLKKGMAVELPGMGTLKGVQREPYHDAESGTYYPASRTVALTAEQNGDLSLVPLLAARECVSEGVARQMWRNYTDALEHKLSTAGQHTFIGLGTITLADGQYNFKADENLNLDEGDVTNMPLKNVKIYNHEGEEDPFAKYDDHTNAESEQAAEAAKAAAAAAAAEAAAEAERQRLKDELEAERQRLENERQQLEAERQRLEAERQRIAAEMEAERQRIAAEQAAKAEAERIAAEQAAKAEAERIAAEQAAKAEAERIAAEQAAKAEAERIAAEQAAKAEAERIAAEQAAKAEAERIATEQAAKAEAERIAAEKAAKAEAERIAAEQAAKAETERIAAEQAAKAEAERFAAERAAKEETERIAAAERAVRAEAERRAAEQNKAEIDRFAAIEERNRAAAREELKDTTESYIFNNNDDGEDKKKNRWLLIILLLLLLLLLAGAGIFCYKKGLIGHKDKPMAEAPASVLQIHGTSSAENSLTYNTDLIEYTNREMLMTSDLVCQNMSEYINEFLTKRGYTGARAAMMERVRQYSNQRMAELLGERFAVQNFIPYDDYVYSYNEPYLKYLHADHTRVTVQSELMDYTMLDDILNRMVAELGLQPDGDTPRTAAEVQEVKAAEKREIENIRQAAAVQSNQDAPVNVSMARDSKQGFDIIAGCYLNRATATQLTARLHELGCDAYIIEKNDLYYVSMGSAANRTSAEALFRHIKSWYDGDVVIKEW